ncbi:MAG: sigma-70 family RNA polymerase sigma factor, partial [Phycisphaerae bacterium]|nr:sigma-70 family RNA polymerase sigma factor [Phycisphaerae bacterium]
MPKAESELVSRACEGDDEALMVLLRAHGPEVRRRVGADIDPRWQRQIELDDLMQVTYMEAFLSIRGFPPHEEGAFGAWLLRIARNNLCDAIRALREAKKPDARKRIELAGDESYVGLMETLTRSSATPSRSAIRHEEVAMMKSAIDKLPETYRRVVEQFDIEFRPPAEIARALGRSVGAVYMVRT